MTHTVQPPVADGRTLRARRTRAAIVDAHIRLLDAGSLRPRAEQIAELAGVSVRSVWGHFPDLESLAEATASEVLARQDAIFRPVDPTAPQAQRIAGFCRQRAGLLERIGPLARASALREPFSPALRAYHRRHVQRVADEARILFAPELARAGGDEGASLLDAVVVAATWGAWTTLRDDLGLDRARARSVMVRTVSALLIPFESPATPPDPTLREPS